MTDFTTIAAADYIDPLESAVSAAMRLAEVVLTHIRSGTPVLISLVGLRGLSSSFFNVLFRRIASEFGEDALEHFVRIGYETETQRLIAERSLCAVRRTPSSER